MTAPRGFSLVELVIALAILALVATLGLQALTGLLRQDDSSARIAAQTAALAETAALLRADLAAAVPVPFTAPGQSPPAPPVFVGDGFIALSVGGQGWIGRAADAPRLSRVVWRLTPDGRLTRQAWPGLSPGTAPQAGPPRTLLTGATGLRVLVNRPGTGWAAPIDSEARVDTGLPRAIRVEIDTAQGLLPIVAVLE